jgi:hypothetical protein
LLADARFPRSVTRVLAWLVVCQPPPIGRPAEDDGSCEAQFAYLLAADSARPGVETAKAGKGSSKHGNWYDAVDSG